MERLQILILTLGSVISIQGNGNQYCTKCYVPFEKYHLKDFNVSPKNVPPIYSELLSLIERSNDIVKQLNNSTQIKQNGIQVKMSSILMEIKDFMKILNDLNNTDSEINKKLKNLDKIRDTYKLASKECDTANNKFNLLRNVSQELKNTLKRLGNYSKINEEAIKHKIELSDLNIPGRSCSDFKKTLTDLLEFLKSNTKLAKDVFAGLHGFYIQTLKEMLKSTRTTIEEVKKALDDLTDSATLPPELSYSMEATDKERVEKLLKLIKDLNGRIRKISKSILKLRKLLNRILEKNKEENEELISEIKTILETWLSIETLDKFEEELNKYEERKKLIRRKDQLKKQADEIKISYKQLRSMECESSKLQFD